MGGTAVYNRDLAHALYRFYDLQGRPVYFGISINPARREHEHSGKAWYLDVDKSRTVVEWHPDYATTRAAEIEAIRREGPPNNKERGPADAPAKLISIYAPSAAQPVFEEARALAKADGRSFASLMHEIAAEYVTKRRRQQAGQQTANEPTQ